MFIGQLFGTFNRRTTDDAVVLGPATYEFWPWSPTQLLVIIVVLVTVAARVDRAVLAWTGLFSLTPVWMFVPPGNQVAVTLLFVVLLIVGDLLRHNLLTRRALAEQAEVSELEKARRAVLEERTRIAREMHDVVAHHMSLIAVQAETAPYRLAVSEPARAEFNSIAEAPGRRSPTCGGCCGSCAARRRTPGPPRSRRWLNYRRWWQPHGGPA